jgi:hypothetical protein
MTNFPNCASAEISGFSAEDISAPRMRSRPSSSRQKQGSRDDRVEPHLGIGPMRHEEKGLGQARTAQVGSFSRGGCRNSELAAKHYRPFSWCRRCEQITSAYGVRVAGRPGCRPQSWKPATITTRRQAVYAAEPAKLPAWGQKMLPTGRPGEPRNRMHISKATITAEPSSQ